MIIGVDGNEANVQERVGGSWATYALLNEFYQQAGPNRQFRIFLQQAPLPDLPMAKKGWQYVVVPKKTVWSQIDLPLALFLKHRDLNVFFSPAHYAPRFCPCETVVMVYDLSFFYYPQDFLKKDLYQLLNWTDYSVKKAKAVIAISENTKQDLLSCYQIKEPKVRVVYLGFTKPKVTTEALPTSLKEPFFLYLGTLQPRKNLTTLILGFEKLLLKQPQAHLYLAGKKGWLYQEIEELINKRRLQKQITLTGYLTQAQKWFLLKKAKALVMPGWYEGFGLPVLEAFSVNTPVICSQSGSLPEASGRAALYFSPDDPSALASAMEEVLVNPKVSQELILKGQKQLKTFSWQKAAREILKVLEG